MGVCECTFREYSIVNYNQLVFSQPPILSAEDHLLDSGESTLWEYSLLSGSMVWEYSLLSGNII